MDGERTDRSGEPPPKKETLDRISELPEAILVHILSLLPMHEVVRTSSLSKIWKNLWTTVPNLVFTNNKSAERFSEFVHFVDQTLIQYRHSKIHRLSLDFQYILQFATHIDQWIRFAMRCDVEELFIDLVPVVLKIGNYTLPQHTFSCSSITNLKLSYCNVVPKGLITWKSLKNLWIYYSDVSDDAITDILLGSPLLEFLELNSCNGFKRLDINSTSLRKLVINGYWYYYDPQEESILEISAPNLHSLEIAGNLGWWRCRLVNMLSLVDANLSVCSTTSSENLINELLHSLIHVKELTLGFICVQVMSRLGLKHWPSLSKRKWLRLNTFIVTMDSPGIEALLQSSLDLETLIVDSSNSMRLEGASVADSCDLGKYWTSREGIIFPCFQRHLKTVKFVGFNGLDLKRVLPFVEFLLKNACVLEKMVISTTTRCIGGKHSCCASKELLEVARKLLSCPRSSLNALVLFTK